MAEQDNKPAELSGEEVDLAVGGSGIAGVHSERDAKAQAEAEKKAPQESRNK